MRYEAVDNVSFTNKDGKTVNIKDMREYPDYQTITSIKIQDIDKVDEIASRDEIYGEDAEGEAYKIVDHNIIKFLENDFDMSKIQRINIPL